MDFTDNKTLIENLALGKETAYIFLLNKYHRLLNAYALTLVHDPAMAQDIVQNVFLKTWKSRKKLNPEFSIQSFLYKSVYNEFINSYQKNRAMMLLQQKYVESASEVIESTDESTMQKMIDIVNKEIRNLPPKCQKIFVLSKMEGLTNQEISNFLNITIKTVEAQITKAFKILKEKLDEKYETILMIIFGIHTKRLA
tara:strand:- start:881 stop:1471 length:591 start_codon:yes stop_codon:yes gene_type:complete